VQLKYQSIKWFKWAPQFSFDILMAHKTFTSLNCSPAMSS
jgi:hypothetical protein